MFFPKMANRDRNVKDVNKRNYMTNSVYCNDCLGECMSRSTRLKRHNLWMSGIPYEKLLKFAFRFGTSLIYIPELP